MAITLNPGFLLLIAALLALVLPNRVRQGAAIAAALAAAWACFAPPFGEPLALSQIGLTLTPLRLDETSQLYGFVAVLCALLCALAATARDDRMEDAALLLHAGGAASAAFAGDFVSYVACACLAALGAAALTVAGRGAESRNAAIRLLTWQALAALALCVGAGLEWAETGAVRLGPPAQGSPAAAALLLGLLIQAGAPLAHVWLRDGITFAAGIGSAALAALAPLPAFVGLARAFAGDPILTPIGLALAIVPLPLAFADSDWRRSAGLGLVSQNGFVIAAIGLATPLALAGAASFAFANAIAALGLMLVLGVARDMVGADQATGAGFALARRAPALAVMGVIAAASIAGVPGTAGYAARSLLLEAFRSAELGWVYAVFAAGAAAAIAHAGFKAPFAALFGPKPAPANLAAPYPLALTAGLCAFLTIAIGFAPRWLYDLAPPGQVFHQPFALSPLISQVQLLAAAGLALLALMWTPLFPPQRAALILDVDWIWRRPGRAAATALGAALLAGYAAATTLQNRVGALVHAALTRAAAAADRPSAPWALGPGLALGLAAAAALLAQMALR